MRAGDGTPGLGVLGPIELRSVAGREIPVGGPIRRALLARLALAGGEVVPVDRLVEDLWQGRPPRTASTALRVHVTRLRHALTDAGAGEGALRHGAAGYRLDCDSVVVDAAEFATLVRAGSTVDGRHRVLQERIAVLRRALSLWRGAAFGDVRDWTFTAAEAGRLDEMRLHAIEERASLELATGEHFRVASDLAALADDHPVRERLCALSVLALYRAGRQADALRAYERCRRHLRDELGVEPSSELRVLEQAVLTQDPDLDLHVDPARDAARALMTGGPPVADSAPPQPAVPGRRSATQLPWAPATPFPFVGRDREVAQIAHRLNARGTDRHLVLIAGEPGVGKTRLAAEVAGRAAAEGQLVLFGRCEEQGAEAVPYRPFAQAVASLDATAFHTEPPGAQDRPPFLDAIDDRLVTLSTERPVLLVLDDLHWADDSTLLVLEHLLRSSRPAAITLIGTYRTSEPAPGLATAMAELARWPGYDLIELGGLDEDAVEALLGFAGAADPGRWSFARRLRRETAGNALFVIELISTLRETGGLDGPGAICPEDAISAGNVRQVVLDRIERLPVEARRCMRAASVIGVEFDIRVLADVLRQEAATALRDLGAAFEARLLSTGNAPWRYVFAHPVVRSTLYDGVAGPERSDVHHRVAQSLRRFLPEDPTLLGDIAHHYVEGAGAGDPASAVRFARQAAHQATVAQAWDVAVHHLREAVELLRQDGGLDDPLLRCGVLLELGEAYNRAGADSKAKPLLAEAADTAAALGRPDLLTRAALAYGGEAPEQTLLSTREDDEVISLLRRALVGVDDDSPEHALVLGRLGQELQRHVSAHRRGALTSEALASARRTGDLPTVAAVLRDRFWASSGPDTLDERVAIAEEIIDIAERTGARDLLLHGTQCQLHAMLDVGDIAAADRAARVRNRLAVELSAPDMLYAVAVHDVLVATIAGRFADADRLAKRARAMREASNPVHAARLFAVHRTQLRWLQGRLDELEAAQERLAQEGPHWTYAASAVLLLMYAEDGRVADAAPLLANFIDAGLDKVPLDYDWTATMACLAVACERLNDARRALPVYEQLLPYRTRNCMIGQSGFAGAVAHHLGALAALMGLWQEATEFLEEALARHWAMGARPFVAMTQEVLGRVRLVRRAPGDDERARSELLQSLETADELGMVKLADRSRRSLAFAETD